VSVNHVSKAQPPVPPALLSVTVVVPVFNSRATLPELVSRLDAVLPRVASRFEVILVNDGSTDDTFGTIETLQRRHPWVRGVDLMRNYGQHNAILCGIRLAQGDITVTIDDDLQNPPEEIPRFLEKLAEGYDVVYGTPQDQRHSLWRVLASQMTRLALQQVLGAETARHVSAYRAIRTNLRDAFDGYRSSFVSIDVLLTWGTSRFAAIPVRHDPRPAGISHYTFRKLLKHSLNMVTGFSTAPLQLASLLGFSATLFGLAVLAYVVGRYLLHGSNVPGFPFLASVISIFSGVQLFAIGVIGEYLARMHFRMLEQPPYTIRKSQSGQPKELT
jgi:glycosyltransferase involved in cell wall biosynthesis